MSHHKFAFSNRNILILGLARQGLALARFFVQQGARVTISDVANEEKLKGDLAKLDNLPVQLAVGGHPLSLLDGCDLVCLSGGVPPQIEIVQAAIQRGIRLSNDSLLTFQIAQERGLGPTLAVTGSSGKTTTTTLTGLMLEASGKRVHVGGNIGRPLLDRLDEIQPGEPLLLELSSFQLELFDQSLVFGSLNDLGPDVAAITNITPNHLDRHPSMAAYAAAKFNLLGHLRPTSKVVLNADDAVTQRLEIGGQRFEENPLPLTWNLEPVLESAKSQLTNLQSPPIFFSRTQPLTAGAWLEGDRLLYKDAPICRRSEIKLRGDHNVSNILAAAAISGAAGATPEAMGQVARTFAGVPHRLEIVAEFAGVTWINDSIATAPERAVAALRSFDPQQQMLILLTGGKDKNLPWQTFADEVLERVSFLIGFGQAGPMVVDVVRQRAEELGRKTPGCAIVQQLGEAVELAARSAHSNTVVLLSPGGTSYDAYRDFEERGENFRKLVKEQIDETMNGGRVLWQRQ
ncbi:MAG: UDP-N-acetylmuramoyl-L-alanine--D-glutamate ligase [Caldilineaceae bacterium]